jgi:hypothetical protein
MNQARRTDPGGRVLRLRVTDISSQQDSNNMMLLLICATMFTEDEHLCACSVNIGDEVRPLPRNRKEAESGPYSTMWKAAIADELESIRERDF